MSDVEIRHCDTGTLETFADDFADCLVTAVEDNAGVSFVLPFTRDEAKAFWLDTVKPGLETGGIILLGAFVDGRVVGTVHLHISLPPNQPHRCEVSKLLVHPEFRQRGIAGKLMAGLEAEAAARGKWLIVLDTMTGGVAEKFYESIGYVPVGSIPEFAANSATDGFHATTFFYKKLPRS